MEMSLENLNSWTLIPKKDYNTNRVTAGRLQLTSGTRLVLDETALQQGQLNNTGVLNVRALEDVISNQKVEYDFQWSTVTIHTDISILVVSEGPSFLSKDFHVPVTVDGDISDIPQHFAKLEPHLGETNLSKLRSYITSTRLIKYDISTDMQQVIENDFMETRREDPSAMTVDDFEKLLTLVRILSLSYGKRSPTRELWMKARSMEAERKARIERLPQASNASQ